MLNMKKVKDILSVDPPRSIEEALHNWPEREEKYTESPPDWRDEIFYFLLPDRFSDGKERQDRLLDCDLSTRQGLERIQALRPKNWSWKDWQNSGKDFFQGGTLSGIKSKLNYLADLGITTLWIGPVFRQRVEENSYHGYGIQDFFDIDPRFGTRQDLIDLVEAAHKLKPRMNIILDVIFNHSGCNWLYDQSYGDAYMPDYKSSGSYLSIWPRNGYGAPIFDKKQALGRDDCIWPSDFQKDTCYLRAGHGSLGNGDINDDNAEHKRTDFETLRKFNLFSDETLNKLILAYQYWIALTDIDGFRIDTFKHVTQDQARNFCNGIKEYAEILGKNDFFLVAEVAGGDSAEDRYLDVTGRDLNACLDIGNQRDTICRVSKGLLPASNYFAGFSYYDEGMGSHRNWGSRHLSIMNDHDHVFGSKIRFAVDESNDHQAAAATAIQLFTLGIPCIYYGTEQGLASGAEQDERQWLSNWGSSDYLLREAMFGPEHPRASGWAGTQGQTNNDIVGFGPHGTSGWHVFNPNHPNYQRISTLSKLRAKFMPLRRGRQYQREISVWDENEFTKLDAGELMAWSRVFDDQEVLVIVNPNGKEVRGGRIIVDKNLSMNGMQVIANTDPKAPSTMKPGAMLETKTSNSRAFVDICKDSWVLGPSEVLVLANMEAIENAGLKWEAPISG